MKIQELLQEAPLPDDWDKSAYKSNKSFASRIQYAKERAKKVGAGSSRVAFEIEYEGRPTILKIAKNKKGMAQNEYEARTLNDYFIEGLGITIPIIDYDEENDPPTWVHVEKAEKMKPNMFKKFFDGLTPKQVMEEVVQFGIGKRYDLPEELQKRYQELIENNEAISSLVDIAGSYGGVVWQDFKFLSNWGVYKNSPVIIDIGLSTEVYDLHYSR